jgi:hypothetical protein
MNWKEYLPWIMVLVLSSLWLPLYGIVFHFSLSQWLAPTWESMVHEFCIKFMFR